MDTGTPPDLDTHRAGMVDVSEAKGQELSALGESFEATPMVLPVRSNLDCVKRFLKGDLYMGRGSRQRSLPKSRYCNNFKVSEYGREGAFDGFREALLHDQEMYQSLWTLSGRRFICHCRVHERCHTDVFVDEFRNSYPGAHDRSIGRGASPRARGFELHGKAPRGTR